MEWIAPIVTGVFALVGTYLSNRKATALMEYRLKELETKVDKHNNVIERTYKLEQKVADLEKLIK